MAYAVQYDVILRVKEALAATQQLVKSFGTIDKAAVTAGLGVEKAEGAIARLGKGLLASAKAAWEAQNQILNVGRASQRMAGEVIGAEGKMAAAIRARNHELARGIAAGHQVMSGRPGHMLGAIGTAGVAAFGAYTAGRALGHLVEEANKLQVGDQRLGLMGASPAEVAQAQDKVRSLSQSYRNLSMSEIQHGLLEDVSIYGDLNSAIDKADVHAHLSSVIKNLEGGKHIGQGWEQEALSAVKSAEILGKFTPDQINKYMPGLLAMKSLFGDQAKIGDYLGAQRLGRQYFLSQESGFSQGVFPAMVQELGRNAGVQLRTAGQIVNGAVQIKKDAQAAMAKYGILGPDGKVGDDFRQLYDRNAFEAAKDLGQRIESVTGVKKVTEADVARGDKSEAELQKYRDTITKGVTSMMQNPNAAAFFVSSILQQEKFEKDAASLLRTLAQVKQAWEDQKAPIRDWNNALNQVSAAWQNLQADGGKPMWDTAISDTLGFSDALNWLNQRMAAFNKNHPRLSGFLGAAAWRGLIGTGVIAGVGLLAAGLSKLVGIMRMTAVGRAGLSALWAAFLPVRALFVPIQLIGNGFMRLVTQAGAIWGVAAAVRGLGTALLFASRSVGWISWIITALEALKMLYDLKQHEPAVGSKQWDDKQSEINAYLRKLHRRDEEEFFGRAPSDMRRDRDAYGPLAQYQAQQQVQVNVHTTEGAPITVHVEGQVDATSLRAAMRGQGQGQAPITAETAGRGQALGGQ